MSSVGTFSAKELGKDKLTSGASLHACQCFLKMSVEIKGSFFKVGKSTPSRSELSNLFLKIQRNVGSVLQNIPSIASF